MGASIEIETWDAMPKLQGRLQSLSIGSGAFQNLKILVIMSGMLLYAFHAYSKKAKMDRFYLPEPALNKLIWGRTREVRGDGSRCHHIHLSGVDPETTKQQIKAVLCKTFTPPPPLHFSAWNLG